jgi:hypothetical protein
MMHDERILKTLGENVNADERLCWRGRHVDTSFLIEVDRDQYLVTIEQGRIASVSKGEFDSSAWRFALSASGQTWSAYWQALPRPGYHDLMAMLKFKYLKMEGDLYPLMSHLLYFKDVLASVRTREVRS